MDVIAVDFVITLLQAVSDPSGGKERGLHLQVLSRPGYLRRLPALLKIVGPYEERGGLDAAFPLRSVSNAVVWDPSPLGLPTC